MDRAVRHVKRQGGTLERISVAVVINEIGRTGDADDLDEVSQADTNTGYSEEDIERFTNLIKGIVGFDAERGDIVTIIAIPFEVPMLVEEAQITWYENTQVTSVIKSIGAAIAFIILIFVVIRPAMKSFLSPTASASSSLGKDGELTQAELSMLETGDNTSLKDIRAKLKPKRSTVSADMLDTANTYDDKVALVRLLVADDAGRVANVLKKMVRPA